jgi:hypothetical protein
MPNRVALNAVMATPPATMRHSPAFDIVAEARGRGSNSISGVDRDHLRHTKFTALRDDIDPRKVVRET